MEQARLFRDFVNDIHEEPSPYLRGERFERLLVQALPKIPESGIAEAYLWKDMPSSEKQFLFEDDSAKDNGVDLVVKTKSGEWIAVQAKFWKNDVPTIEVDKFLSYCANLKHLSWRWVVTVGGWSTNVDAKMGEGRRASIFNALNEWGVFNLDQGVEKHELTSPQEQAVNDCLKGFQDHDRGRLTMACGSGKTLVSLNIAKRLLPEGGRVLYATSGIGLVAQTRREWLNQGPEDMTSIVVCSDKDAGKDENALRTGEQTAPVTTEPSVISYKINNIPTPPPSIYTDINKCHEEPRGIQVVFSTYHSIPRIVEAQERFGASEFDLLICDEAHRTAGILDQQESSGFKLVHSQILARKRLYQTATPRIYTERSKTVVRKNQSEKESARNIVDMSDVKVYGPEFHSLSFSKALELMPERMCDYRIVVMLMGRHHGNEGVENAVKIAEIEDRDSRNKKTNSTIGARLAALVKTLHGGAEIVSIDGQTAQGTGQYVADISNCIVYCNTVIRSRWVRDTLNNKEVNKWGFKQALSEQQRSESTNSLSNIPIQAEHLDAKSRSFDRFVELDSLRSARNKGIRKVVSNVGVLSEGIDVPALDSICFLEDRKSEIDIVQAVGRIMRKPSIDKQGANISKEFGYIIVPVMVDIEKDLFDQISSREDGWRILGQVLRALRAHDPRIETDLHERIIIQGPSNGNGGGNRGGSVSPGFLERLRAGEYNQIIPSVVASSGMNPEPAEVANLIESAVHRAAKYLREESLEGHLAQKLGMQGQESQSQKKTTDACTVAALVLCNAMLMHQRIVQANSSRFQELGRVDAIRAHGTPEGLLTDGWNCILEEDYEPVFRQPLNLLNSLHFEEGQVPSGVRSAIHTLAENAVDTAERYAKMGMDHAGPLFQRVMKNKSADGAFFTLPVAATLLAELVLDEIAPRDDGRWSDPEIWEREAILDPSCGSGTLLMAMLTAVKRRAILLEADEKALSSIHKNMVECGLTGLDINAQSIQIAACQQTIGDTSVNYKKMGLWEMPHGLLPGRSKYSASADDVALGSLELFLGSESKNNVQQEMNYRWSELFDKNTVQKTTRTQLSDSVLEFEDENLQDRLKRTRIVVCNPPYTNSAGRADKFTTEVKKAMQAREAITKEYVDSELTGGSKVINSASLQTFFTPLVDLLVNNNVGVVGKIMPAVACAAAPAKNQRKFLAEKFHVSKIITLHAHGKINWSTETSINETIVILDRKINASKPTKFVALRRRPESEEEAIELADSIQSLNLDDWGNVYDWPRDRMLEGDWSPAMWYHFELAEVARQLRLKERTLFLNPKSWVSLGENAEIFYTSRGLGYTNKWREAGNAEKPDLQVCKGSGESVHLNIFSEPRTSYVCAITNNDKKRELEIANMQAKNSILLLTERQATDSARLSAIMVSTPSVGSGWMPVGGVDERTAKAWVVYLNSTLGRISLLSRRGKKLTYPKYSVEENKRIVVPNMDSECSFDALLHAFEETKSKEVKQYRDGNCEARIIWDEAVSEVSGIPLEKIKHWRTLLNNEPSVLGNKATVSK